jgi:hypothetical protein
MRTQTAMPERDRLEIEQAIDHNPVQQVCRWIIAHKLDACRACNGFRIEELGLSEFLPALRSRR